MKRSSLVLLASLALLAAAGCTTVSRRQMPLRTVPHVDLNRYMGDWRVIEHLPNFAEKGLVDSVESYRLRADGDIDNWFEARKGSFDAPLKRIVTARAIVIDRETNAEWKVKFLRGLIAADYLIIDLDPDYQWTVVGHPSRKYGWVMARDRTLDETTLDGIHARLREQGYDPSKFQKVPQVSQ